MVDMEDSDLVVFLAQDEKECVEKLNNFGEVVQPYHRCKLFVCVWVYVCVCVCVYVCGWMCVCVWACVWVGLGVAASTLIPTIFHAA